MKNLKILCLLLGVLLVLSGCSLNKTEPNEEKQVKQIDEMGNEEFIDESEKDEAYHLIKKVSDNLSVDADIYNYEKKQYAIYSVRNKIYTKDDMQIFVSSEEAELAISENPNRPERISVETVQGSSLAMGDGSVWYAKTLPLDEEIVAMIERYLLHTEERENTKQLAFQNREDAIKLGEKRIKEVLSCEPKVLRVVAMEYQELEKLHNEYQIELQEKQWSKEDDMYYIQYGIKLGDLFLHHGILQEPISMAIDVFANFQVNVTILIDKDGIRYFYFRNTLDGLDKATKMKDIISAEEALKKIENIYDTIILTTPITISKIWLEYLPIPNWKETSEIEVRPYWCIQVDEMNSQGKEASEVFRINAITGGDLSYGE